MKYFRKALFLVILLVSISTWGFASDTNSSNRGGYVTGQGVQPTPGKKKPAGNRGSTGGSAFHRPVNRYLPGRNAPPGDFNDAPLQPTVKDSTQGSNRNVVQAGRRRGPRIGP